MLDSLKIGGVNFKVIFVQVLKDEKDGHPIDGQIDHSAAEISIEANINRQVQAQTILHEILHAIEVQTGRRHEIKEPMIDALAFGLYQVLRDNPQLVKMVTK